MQHAHPIRPSVARPLALSLASLLVFAAATLATAPPALADPSAPSARVHPDAESVEPLRVGAQVPSARVRTIDGDPVDVATLTKERGALLVFYRGGW